ncbi:MAG: hypothetical protein U1F23_12885 [Lysobacterales bacterium]
MEKKNDRSSASIFAAAREVVLTIVKPLESGERQLRNRGYSGLAMWQPRDRHRIEVAHPVVDEILLDVAHHAQRELGY